MPQSAQDNTARRFQSFDNENTPPRYDAGYDCEPPPDVREELRHPRRARILHRTERGARAGIWKWVFAVGLCALILVCVIAHYGQQRESATPAVKAMPTPHPAPTSAATPVSLPS